MDRFFKNRLTVRIYRATIPYQRPHLIGAVFDAGAAPDAHFIVNHDHPVIPLIGGLGGANIGAGGFLAMIAQHRQENSVGMRELAQFLLKHGSLKNPCGRIVFRFAGNHTGIAANTSFQIDNHAVSGHRVVLLKYNGCQNEVPLSIAFFSLSIWDFRFRILDLRNSVHYN
jgi:hypothetical protein